MVHARRKLFELAAVAKAPIAAEAVRRIDELFKIEREVNGRPAAERLAAREERAEPLAGELEAWLRAQHARVSPKSETGKAIACQRASKPPQFGACNNPHGRVRDQPRAWCGAPA